MDSVTRSFLLMHCGVGAAIYGATFDQPNIAVWITIPFIPAAISFAYEHMESYKNAPAAAWVGALVGVFMNVSFIFGYILFWLLMAADAVTSKLFHIPNGIIAFGLWVLLFAQLRTKEKPIT